HQPLVVAKEKVVRVREQVVGPAEVPQTPVAEEVDTNDGVEQQDREQCPPGTQDAQRQVGLLQEARDEERYRNDKQRGNEAGLAAVAGSGDQEGRQRVAPHGFHEQECTSRDGYAPAEAQRHEVAPAGIASSASMT